LITGVDAGTASGLIPFSQGTGRNPFLFLPPPAWFLSSPPHHHPVSKKHYLILKYQWLLDAPGQSRDLPPVTWQWNYNTSFWGFCTLITTWFLSSGECIQVFHDRLRINLNSSFILTGCSLTSITPLVSQPTYLDFLSRMVVVLQMKWSRAVLCFYTTNFSTFRYHSGNCATSWSNTHIS